MIHVVGWARWGWSFAFTAGIACGSFESSSPPEVDHDAGAATDKPNVSPVDASADAPPPEPIDASGYANLILSDQPLAYWRMTPKTAVTIADQTPRGNDLQLNGSGPFDFDAAGVGSPGDHALALNGSDQYAVPLDSGIFDFDGTKPFTIELWASLRTVPDEDFFHTLAIRADLDPPHRTGWDFYLTKDQSAAFERGVDGGGVGGAPAGVARTSSFPDRDKFHHYVATYDGQTLELYVDGAPATVHQNDAGASLPKVSAALRFGADRNGTHLWPGVIDEIAIYDRALPMSRIQAHRAAATIP